MAIYEYQCIRCDRIVEVTHRMSEEPMISCLKCGSETKRIISTVGFRLKGDGWFKPTIERNDDYSV